jgi:hypothetical protein
MLLFTDSGNRYLKNTVFVLSGFVLAVQVYASGSRASWLAALGAILFLLYRKIKEYVHSVNSGILFNPIIYFFLILCFVVLFVPFSKYLYGLKKDSADGRLLIAAVSMEMVKNAPVFGSGISGFRSGYLTRQAEYFQSHPDSPYRRVADDVEMPFNEFLKILAEQGIIGLLLFACLIYCLFESKTRKKHVIPRLTRDPLETLPEVLLFSIVICILVFGLFSYPFDKLPFTVLFVFSLAILSQNRHPVFTIRLRRMNCVRIPLLLVLCLIAGKIVRDTYHYARACRTWNWALAHFTPGKEELLFQLKELYPVLSNNPVFLTTYGKALCLGEHFREAAVVLEKAVERQPLSVSYIELGKCYEAEGFTGKALACWEHAALMVPSRFTPLYLTMKLHFKNEEYGKAHKYAEQLLAKKIKIDNPEIDEMKHEALAILGFHPP